MQVRNDQRRLAIIGQQPNAAALILLTESIPDSWVLVSDDGAFEGAILWISNLQSSSATLKTLVDGIDKSGAVGLTVLNTSREVQSRSIKQLLSVTRFHRASVSDTLQSLLVELESWLESIDPNSQASSQPMDAETAILQTLAASPKGLTTDQICVLLQETPQDLGSAFQNLSERNLIFGFAGFWLAAEQFLVAKEKFIATLRDVHEEFPQTEDHSALAVAQQADLNWKGKILDRVIRKIEQSGEIFTNEDRTRIYLPEFALSLTPKQSAFLERIIQALEVDFVNTKNPHKLSLELHAPIQAVQEMLRLAVRSKTVIEVDLDVFYTHRQIETIAERLREEYQDQAFRISDAKELLETSRKYIAPLLDHLQKVGFSTREEDEHRMNLLR